MSLPCMRCATFFAVFSSRTRRLPSTASPSVTNHTFRRGGAWLAGGMDTAALTAERQRGVGAPRSLRPHLMRKRRRETIMASPLFQKPHLARRARLLRGRHRNGCVFRAALAPYTRGRQCRVWRRRLLVSSRRRRKPRWKPPWVAKQRSWRTLLHLCREDALLSKDEAALRDEEEALQAENAAVDGQSRAAAAQALVAASTNV